ncbi:MAG: hypothetical protein FJX77_14650, partial [Armatimonadetes bacterium]|nr:hypothetical protein [Armatimonadota bacterium]
MPGREVSEPGIPFSRRSLVGAGLLALCPPLLAPAAGQENQGEEDPHYDRVLKAYRKQLSPEESAALEEEEPGPTLYGNTRTPGEHDLTRLFASLPDPAHARLRREGYLKWRADALPRA